MAKKFDAKAKAKRQKIMACAGAVILVGLLAIQVPRTMKMMNASAPTPDRSAEAAPATPVPGGADPSLLPTLGTTGGSTQGASPGGTLIDSDPAPAPEAGHLVSFGRFASKDPFAEQIDDGGSGGGTSGEAASGVDPSGESAGGAVDGGDDGAGQRDGGVVGSSPGSDSSSSGGGGSSATASGTAVIAVNGVESTVSVKGEFPTDVPVFVLVSVGKGVAKIAIAGGAFASGAPTITLTAGKTITLVNTADGVRYELKLVRTGG